MDQRVPTAQQRQPAPKIQKLSNYAFHMDGHLGRDPQRCTHDWRDSSQRRITQLDIRGLLPALPEDRHQPTNLFAHGGPVMSLNTEFPTGAKLELNGLEYVSGGRGPSGKIKLIDRRNRTTRYFHEEQLTQLADNGRCRMLSGPKQADVPLNTACETTVGVTPGAVYLPADISTLPEKDQRIVHRRLAYVKGARQSPHEGYGPTRLGKVIKDVATAIGDPTPPNWRSVSRWVKHFEKRGLHGLVSEHRGNSLSRLDERVEELIQLALSEHYLQPYRPSLKLTHLHLEGLIEKENEGVDPDLALFCPSYRALRRRVAELDRFNVCAARFGKQYAQKIYRTYSRSPRATRFMEVVQIDHTILDAEVAYGGVIRLGRPTLTIARDQYTGAIVGLVVSFDPPSYASVMLCLRMTIGEKVFDSEISRRFHRPWTMRGIPERILVDNGAEFRGADLENACASLGIDLVFCPPGKPWFKSQVERQFGDLRQKIVLRLRARTFTLKEERSEFDRSNEPVLDLDEVKAVLLTWAINVHNESPYVGTGLPPRIAHERSEQLAPSRTDLSDDEVRVYLCSTERRALHPYGIELYGLTYTSTDLTMLRQQIDRHPRFISRNKTEDGRLIVKYDPLDLGSIYVLDPISNTYISAKCTIETYAKGLTKHRHRLNRVQARLHVADYVDAKALLRASREIDQMIANLSISDAERLGKALARAMKLPGSTVDVARLDVDGALNNESRQDTPDPRPEPSSMKGPALPQFSASGSVSMNEPQTVRKETAADDSKPALDESLDDLCDAWTT